MPLQKPRHLPTAEANFERCNNSSRANDNNLHDFMQLENYTKYSLDCFPLDTGRKLNVHKTFRRCQGRLLNVLCTFNLRPVSRGLFSSSDLFFSYMQVLVFPGIHYPKAGICVSRSGFRVEFASDTATIGVVLVSLLLTLNIFHTLF